MRQSKRHRQAADTPALSKDVDKSRRYGGSRFHDETSLEPKVTHGQELAVLLQVRKSRPMESTRRLQDFAKRLNAALDASGFPAAGEGRQTALGKRMNVSQKGARKWLVGEGMPSTARLQELARVARTTVGYLMGVETSGNIPPTIGGKSPILQHTTRITGKVPLVSWDTVGTMDTTDLLAPGVAEDWIVTTAPVQRRTFALQVRDDHMEPDLPEGCFVVVEPDMIYQAGDFVVVQGQEGDSTLKKLERDAGEWMLVPSNPRYPVRPLGDYRIVGVVRALERRFR